MTEKTTPEAMLLNEDLARLFRAWLLEQPPDVQDLLRRIYIDGGGPPGSPRDELKRVRALNRFRRVALAWLADRARSRRDPTT